MPKMEEVKEETHMQIRKTRCNMATIDRKKVVGKLAEKWKGSSTIAEISKNNRDRGKKRSKKKRVRMG